MGSASRKNKQNNISRNHDMNVTTNQLLEIIGSLYVENLILRNQVIQLQQEEQSLKLDKDESSSGTN